MTAAPPLAALSLLATLGLGTATQATAQNWATVPKGFDQLRGNAAASMPLRWSWGLLHTILDDSLVADQAGVTWTHMRLRRPSFFDEPAYPASTIELEITIGESDRSPARITGDRFLNTMTNPVVVLPRQTLSIPATPAAAQADTVGQDLLSVALTTPYTVPAGADLLIEVRTFDTQLSIVDGQWIDCVSMANGLDRGLSIPVGQHGCGGRTSAGMRLAPSGSPHPAYGSAASVRLTNALPGKEVVMMIGLDPLAMTAPVPFGTTLGIFPMLPNCQIWAPWDFVLVGVGTTSIGGNLGFSLDLPATNPFSTVQIGLQALILEDVVTGVSASNGVVLWPDSVGVGPDAATAIFPEDVQFSTWLPFPGFTPVFGFGS